MTTMLDAPAHSDVHLDWPLMRNNITVEDLEELQQFLGAAPVLTHSHQVKAFEEEWSAWLGTRYSVMVNSGSSANLLTMSALREAYGGGEIIVPTLTWVSDIASVVQCGFKPVFVDIDPRTLGMNAEHVIAALTPQTRAVFLTHILGYNALTQRLLDELAARQIPLIEDVCESHGATFKGRKLGTYGLMSNFSFYYAHHMTTIEGGMISTDNADLYEMLRMFRSHGMVREAGTAATRQRYMEAHPDLNPDFIFAFPAYNVRPTEINAVLGRAQLKRLDANNARRSENLRLFLELLDPAKFRTDFATSGSSNYALTLVLQEPDPDFRDRIEAALRGAGVEFRRGTSGGGNQLRQPYVQKHIGVYDWHQFPEVEHVHFYGYYIGNYPDLQPASIRQLCALLNSVESTPHSANFSARLRAVEEEEALLQAGTIVTEIA